MHKPMGYRAAVAGRQRIERPCRRALVRLLRRLTHNCGFYSFEQAEPHDQVGGSCQPNFFDFAMAAGRTREIPCR